MNRKKSNREKFDSCVAEAIKRVRREVSDDTKPLDKIVAALTGLDKLIPQERAEDDSAPRTGVVLMPQIREEEKK